MPALFDAPTKRYAIDTDCGGTVNFTVPDPDFSVRQLRLNAVLRWEYRPGSTLYLVWAQARSNPELEPGLRLGRDLERLVGRAPMSSC
jgi:hypothetical protein